MKAEQQALLAKAAESLEAAAVLYEHEFYDFAVSRAYYSMFYVAEALLLGEELSFAKHSGVISAFGQYFAKPGILPRKFHRYLLEAQESRTVGDYDTGPGLTSAQAAESMDRARQFLGLAQRTIAPAEDTSEPSAGDSQGKTAAE